MKSFQKLMNNQDLKNDYSSKHSNVKRNILHVVILLDKELRQVMAGL